MDLNLVHTNPLVDYPRLTAPNTKYVGGMHIKDRPSGPLPSHIADFIKDAHDGIILFSLGYTGFEPQDIPSSLIQAFINSFSKLKQKVVMRFDRNLLAKIPENVLVIDWLPQTELLGKTKTSFPRRK